MNESGGDWTPEKGPIVVTAGDIIIPLDPFTVSLEVGGVETPATISAVKATVRERNWYNAPIVMELPMTLSGSTVTPASWGGRPPSPWTSDGSPSHGTR